MGRERRKEIKRHLSEEKLDELLRDAEEKHRIRRLGFVKNLVKTPNRLKYMAEVRDALGLEQDDIPDYTTL